MQCNAPGLTPAGVLNLDSEELGDMEMPVVGFVTQTLLYMKGVRKSGKIVDLIITRAHLESRIKLLRETIHYNKLS